ncbi:MAG: ornithine cyclodeaminase family protein [Ignavibacteria bacterium]|nr:ornithine cyclodeaminase family protein [Ignavibacteria bacterium]
MRLLTRDDIRKLISMREVIELMKTLFCEVGKGNVVIPDRTMIDLNNGRDAILFMPGFVTKSRSIGVKVVSVFPENISTKIPTTNATVLLNDPDTGKVISMLEGGYITSVRTGAVSAVATELLAVKDARKLGVFGSGVQARTQIEAILEVRNIESVKIYDVNHESSNKLALEFQSVKGNGCVFQPVESPDDLVTDSQVIVTATTSETPVFDGNLLRDGTHINSIGSFKPHVREVDDQTITRSKIFVDARSLSLKEGGDLIIPLEKGLISKDDVQADLGELVLGKKKGRESADEITFFKSVGMSVQDIVVANAVYKKALDNNVGVEF